LEENFHFILAYKKTLHACGADFELIPCAVKEMGDLNVYVDDHDEWSETVTVIDRATIFKLSNPKEEVLKMLITVLTVVVKCLD